MIKWYLNRLRTMSVLELPYRLNQVIQKKYEQYFCIGKSFYNKSKLKTTNEILNIELINKDLFLSEVLLFGIKWDYNQNSINWQHDIFSGKAFPMDFSKSINIRKDPELSAKNVWEINRLQFLPQVAINYKITNDKKYLHQFVKLTTSWIDSNPYLTGVNWYSNIEVNIRLINWFFCWEILQTENLKANNTEFEQFIEEKWIPSIYQHCLYSFNNPSKFSSANNHLISEYAGLFIASSLWKFNESDRWLEYSRHGLENEIIKQHSKGINKEEAAEYIQFITDFFLLSYIVAKQTGKPFSENYTQILRQIFGYIYDFTDCKCNFPKYGDEDDGKVISLSSDSHYNNFKSILTSAAILFNDERFKSKSAGFDLKNQILFGIKGKLLFDQITDGKPLQHSAFYKDEGHFIFRKQIENKEIYLHFDAAPLGYLSLAAHGHSDALSFTMNINGIPVFVDSGTYSYHVAKKWRNYFVSTMAHNTICIDSKNQAKQLGDTMWTDHYRCNVLSVTQTNENESVKANHNGYKNLIHAREVRFDKKSDTFSILDEVKITDGKEHNCIILFHLHPKIKLTKISSNKVFLSHSSGIKITLSIDGFPGFSESKGQENPIFGWYSDSFMQKEPSIVLFSIRKTRQSFQSNIKIEIYEY